MNKRKSNYSQDSMANDIFSVGEALLKCAYNSIKELGLAIRDNQFPALHFAVLALCGTIMFYFGVDRLLGLPDSFYSTQPKRLITWVNLAIVFPMFFWGMWRAYKKDIFLKALTNNFNIAGIKTGLGKYPCFIFMKDLGDDTRHLRFYNNGVSGDKFRENKSLLETVFGGEIEVIKEDVYASTIDIILALKKLPETVLAKEHYLNVKPMEFVVGKSRSGIEKASFQETPHFLVAGTTGYGKSSFIRQMLTTLIVKNKNLHIDFIDLKFGTEAAIFRGLKNFSIVTDVNKAIETLVERAERIKEVGVVLAENNVQSIYELRKIPKEKRRYPKGGENALRNLKTSLIVIDEAVQLFTMNAQTNAKQAMKARSAVATITALGRAAGVHVVVATQRPDANVVDMVIKANLAGRICFHMTDNASSMTILDNGSATKLPAVKGRAIYQHGGEKKALQTPLLESKEAINILEKLPKLKNEAEFFGGLDV